jgi:hypothetical protein
MNATAKRIEELYDQLTELGELKSRSLAMSRPEYAEIEQHEEKLKTELRQLLDTEAP